MHKEHFILPGYLVGISCLGLITYRTLLAVGTATKAITVTVNQYGEQYLDIAFLIVMWIVSTIGLLSLRAFSKDTQRITSANNSYPQRVNQQNQQMPFDVSRYSLRNDTPSPRILHTPTTNIHEPFSPLEQHHDSRASSDEQTSVHEGLTSSRKP